MFFLFSYFYAYFQNFQMPINYIFTYQFNFPFIMLLL